MSSSTQTLTVPEGGSNSYALVLSSRPTGDVAVGVTLPAGSDLTLSSDMLTFTVDNWDDAQTVTVTAAEDDDGVTDAVVTLTHTISGGGYGSTTVPNVEVSITENDSAGLVISKDNLTVGEGDAAGTSYTVALATEPSGTVSVSITGHAGTDLTLDKTTLTFTVDDWATVQTVTVKAGQDEDAANDAATLTHTASGGDYANVTKDLPVAVTDDDSADIVLSKTDLAVTEGDAAGTSYTVALATEPSGSVSVSITGHADTDLSLLGATLSSDTLTFTVDDWATAQTVTVKAGHDDDGANDTATLTHTASGGDYANVTKDLPVAVTDDDSADIVLSKTGLAVTEGDAAGTSYTVALATKPSGEVTVTISGQASTDLSLLGATLSSDTLTFTVDDWATAQTVTVKAGQDEDGANDTATLTHTASGGDYANVTKDLPVAVTDDDSADIVLSKTDLAVTEGDAAGTSYTVALATEPSGSVSVSITGHADTDLSLLGATLSSDTLTFTVDDWATAQTVTVKAGQDEDGANDTATLTHTASGGDYANVTKDLPVAVTDDDTADIVLSGTGLTVTEGDAAGTSYTVALVTEPSGSVTVSITGHAGTDLTLDKTTLTFTVDDWATAQTVTVKAGHDDDGSADTATLTHTASGGDYANVTKDLPVAVTDDDSADIVLSKTDLAVTEGDAAGTSYTVALATEPSGSVSVSITGHADTDLSLLGATLSSDTLTFTVDDWATAQTVTVKAGQDEDGANDTATLTHTASGGDYANVTKDLPVAVTDDDTADIVLSGTGLTVTEGDAAGTSYTVALVTEPSGSVTVSITGHAGTDLTLDKTTLTFTVDDWATAQTVTVKAGHDDDGSADTATLTHTASGGDYANVTKDLPVAVTDDDSADIVLSKTDLAVTEGDAAGTSYTVALATEPSGSVSVSITGHADTDLSLSGPTLSSDTLTFTVDDWATAQTVTVKAGQDEDGANDTATLTHTASGGDYVNVTKDLTVTVTDDDSADIVLSEPGLTLTEGDAAGTSYTVALATEPSGSVSVSITGHADTDLSLLGATLSSDTLTFTVDDWATAQTVTVKAVQDEDAANDTATLTHTASGGDYANVTKDLPVAVTDDDSADIVLSKTGLAVTEGDAAGTSYTVALATKPSGEVTVTISGQASTDLSLLGATLSSDTLTFTVDDWATAQTVTVKAGQDEDGVNDAATLTHTASGGDYVNVTKDLTVTVTDDDSADIVLSEPGLTLTEGDAAGTSYTVALATKPSGEVTVTISGQASTDLSLSGATLISDTLTFTVNDWNVPQTVTVKAAHDDDAVNDTATLTHTASGADYANVTEDLTVTVTDNDSADIVLSKTGLTVTEGDAAGSSYTVALATKPSGSVTVSITGHAGTDLSLSGATLISDTLTFTVNDWNVPQTVTVKAAHDDDAVNDAATLTHTASGGDYANVTADLPVTVTDDDSADIVLSKTGLTVTEGDAAGSSYTVALATKPSGSVTVSITGHAGTDLSLLGATLSSDTLTFTVDDWNVAQTVTIKAAHDDDGSADTATLTHTASGGDYANVTKDLTVTVTDDDSADIVLSKTDLAVTEGDAAGTSYTVALATEPSGSVSVSITGHADTDLSLLGATLSSDTLTFTVDDWATAQTVTVKAGQDEDAVNDAATLTHTASGGDYANVTKDLTVTVTDDDSADIVLSKPGLTLTEGDAVGSSYTVALATEPSSSVSVSITGHAGTDLTLDKTTLTFAEDDWATAQTVTVNAGHDDDGSADTATLTHTASGGDYANVTKDLPVAVTDDDSADIVLSKTDLTVTEGDAAGTSYTVALATKPSGEVTVTISGHASTDVTLSGTTLISDTLTFTVDDWNVAQTVTIKAAHDDDGSADTATLTHTASGADYANVTEDLTVTVTDNDTPAVTIEPTALSVVTGRTNKYSVKLATEPTGDVTVTISGHASTAVTPDKTTLTFTVGNWSMAQTITVSAAQSAATGKVTLTHAVSGADYGSVTADSVVVSVVAVAGQQSTLQVGVSSSTQTLTVPEGGSNSYALVLSSRPTGDVAIGVTLPAGTDLTLSSDMLTFTTGNWDTAQTVTVTAAEDDDGVTDAEVTLTHTISGGGYGSTTVPDVEVSITENDSAGLVISKDNLTVGEGDAAGTSYTVALATEPSGTVSVSITGHSSTDLSLLGATLSSDTLTFTVDDWATAQTVTVKAGQDEDAANDTATLTHTASGGDYANVTADLPVTVTDDDSADIVLSGTGLTVTEGDAAGTSYTVALVTEPSGSVTVSITGHWHGPDTEQRHADLHGGRLGHGADGDGEGRPGRGRRQRHRDVDPHRLGRGLRQRHRRPAGDGHRR